MSGHRGHIGGHSHNGNVRILIADGKVDAGVLTEFPLAKTLEVVIETGTALELPLGRNTISFRQAANDILWATTSVSFGRTALARPNESREWQDISPEISGPITGQAGKVRRR
jgi:hypothetical protein